MFDLKGLNSALSQLEEERGIPKEKILGAIEDALAAAYKKDYGKRGQIVRAHFDLGSGTAEFYRVKIVVDESVLEHNETGAEPENTPEIPEEGGPITYNEEQHILLADAKKIKADAAPGDEISFPLETKGDYGRIAAQTAKQVIIQRIREAEKVSVLDEYVGKKGGIVNGTVQRIERGNVFIDLGRTTAILPREEQIPGEYYRQGERIKAYLYAVEETGRNIDLRLSRAHPQFLVKLFEIESPEVASGTVVIEAVAREAGARSKVAVYSRDENVDPVGSLVGQRGIRVNTVINELGGEKLDIIEWFDNPENFIAHALSPAKIKRVTLSEDVREAKVEVDQDQFSLAIGRGGQNVRLAAKLTGWKIDISAPSGERMSESPDGVKKEDAPQTQIGEAAESIVPETLPTHVEEEGSNETIEEVLKTNEN